MNVKKLGLAMALVAGLGMSGAAHSNGILAGNGVGASAETTVTGGVVGDDIQWTISESVAYSPEAGPWKKVLIIDTSQGGGIVGGFKLHETITNASQVAWTDWHEEVLTPGWSWEAYEVTGPDFAMIGYPFGTTILDIYFLLPVLPGQTITIEKWLQPAAGASFPIEVRQYPTVPEPATLALVGLGLAGLGFSRRRSH